MIDQRGKRFNFIHTERTTILSYKYDASGWKPTFDIAQHLRGSVDKFIYLSPFAGWIMTFDQTDGVDFTHASQIVLAFKASTIPAKADRRRTGDLNFAQSCDAAYRVDGHRQNRYAGFRPRSLTAFS